MYERDLAEIQHRGFGDFAASAAPGLLGLLREAKIERGTVVDLGCGSGIWLRELSFRCQLAFGLGCAITPSKQASLTVT